MTVADRSGGFGFPGVAPPFGAPAPRTPALDVLNLKAGEHLCLFYEHEPAEQFPALMPFLKEGLDAGERVVYVCDDSTVAEVELALTRQGVQVERARAAGSLLLWTRDEWRQAGDLDSEAKARQVRGVIAEAFAAGYSGIRFGVEMTWTLGPDIDCGRLAHWEATINTVFTPDLPARIICQYSRRRLSPEVLYAALSTHPVAVLGTEAFHNPFHQSPFILKQPAPPPTPVVASEQIEWMLGQLRWQRAYESERARRLEVEHELEHVQSETDQLRLSNEAKDEILGLVSHELRTPITLIQGYSRFLDRSLPDLSVDCRTAVNEITAGAQRLTRIVTNLLVLARLDAGSEPEFEPILVGRTLMAVIEEHQKRFPERMIRVAADAAGVPVLGNDVYVEQLISNLISNAEKYSPPDQAIDVAVALRGGECAITVLDRGIGISEADAEHVFEAFYRSEDARKMSSGLGIGLAVCKRLVDVQNGAIWCAPRPGGGTEFGFALPLAAEMR